MAGSLKVNLRISNQGLINSYQAGRNSLTRSHAKTKPMGLTWPVIGILADNYYLKVHKRAILKGVKTVTLWWKNYSMIIFDLGLDLSVLGGQFGITKQASPGRI
jgi:hypothetical protein